MVVVFDALHKKVAIFVLSSKWKFPNEYINSSIEPIFIFDCGLKYENI